eukprot:618452-Alexandrium_andersonii.AAC.1
MGEAPWAMRVAATTRCIFFMTAGPSTTTPAIAPKGTPVRLRAANNHAARASADFVRAEASRVAT